jgi:hypothetical protein
MSPSIRPQALGEIVESGELQRSVKAYLTNVGSNGANGGGKIGGVANHNAE